MKYRIFIVCVVTALLSAMAYGQSAPPPPSDKPQPPGQDEDHMLHKKALRPHPMEMPPKGPWGKWWKNAELVQKLQISDSQLQQLEQIFQESRLRLIDLHASLDKEEAILEPLMEADSPDESQVYAQIDKVASARAELEKANTRMLLGIRKVLTTDQWKKLQSYEPEPHFGPFPGKHFHYDGASPLPAPAPFPEKPSAPQPE